MRMNTHTTAESFDFVSGTALLSLCEEQQISISEAMMEREIQLGETTRQAVLDRLVHSVEIMKESTAQPLEHPVPSMGGLIGGEARKVWKYAGLSPRSAESDGAKSAVPASFSTSDAAGHSAAAERSDAAGCSGAAGCSDAAKRSDAAGRSGASAPAPLCGTTLSKAIAYAMAVLEVNASMGLIVAAPTAGSSGVIPGAVLSVCEDYGFGDAAVFDGLLNASAIGYLLMRNASVAGAEAGCQAEVGAASAMAASAIAQLLGGSPHTCLQAASLAISNLLGLVCDPIAGLVESPCQTRNAIGVANAFTSAQLALAGVNHPVPFDEMAEAMYKVGKSLPFELRETALGGNAATPTGCSLCSSCRK